MATEKIKQKIMCRWNVANDHDVQTVPISTRRQSTWKAQQSQAIIATCQHTTRENGLSLSRGRQYSLSLSDREGRRNDRYAAAITVHRCSEFRKMRADETSKAIVMVFENRARMRTGGGVRRKADTGLPHRPPALDCTRKSMNAQTKLHT